MKKHKIIITVGARPNFMKASPLVKELKKHRGFQTILVHTGQHYDLEMSDFFFRQLKLPKPDISLGVGSGTHGKQTGKIIIAFEKICFEKKPDLVIVMGDVNSTLACALVAAKINIPVAHVEAGLRSFDWSMPEEINRVLTDHLADYLFTTCRDANLNLEREGIPVNRIFFTGNIMIDTLLEHIKIAKNSTILERLNLKDDHKIKKYAVITLHRPSNVDDPVVLRGILGALNKIAQTIPVVFPAHPRTIKCIKRFRLGRMVNRVNSLPLDNLENKKSKALMLNPLGYLDFLCLMSSATLVFTDSGGIQEETTVLGIPCLTIRNNTERPITISEGTNTIVGNDPNKIVKLALNTLKKGFMRKRIPKYWDGNTAKRIVNVLMKKM